MNPSRSYFSLLDSSSIEHMKRREGLNDPDLIARRLRSKLKAATLLYDQVLFRATVVLPAGQKPNYARGLIDEASELLKDGVLVPELRAGDDPLGNQLVDHPERFNITKREARLSLKVAEAIDGATEKHEPDANALSKARSAQLVEHVFRQWCLRTQLGILKPNVSLDRLKEFFDLLMAESPPDRKKDIFPALSELYRDPSNANLLMQNIYFGMGALQAKSDVFLPDGLVLPDSMQTYPQLETNTLSFKARKVADEFSIGVSVSDPAESFMIRADDVLAKIKLLEPSLEALSWGRILKIRKSTAGIKGQERIWEIIREAKNGLDLSDQLHLELLREKRRTRWLANAKRSLAVVTVPIGSYDPIVGLFFSMGLLGIDLVENFPIVKAAFTPLLAFADKVNSTEQHRLLK